MQASSLRSQSLPQVEEHHHHRLAVRPRTTFFAFFLYFFRSFLHYFFPLPLAVSKVICLIQDMSYQMSKACDAGLAFDLARTLGAHWTGWRMPPDHCHALAFLAHQ